MKNKSYQTGMTLIEIMIALLIGAFLLGGVVQIFISSKQAYRMLENLSSMQERGRFAMDFISRDIRGTSYWACLIRPAGDIVATDNAAGDTITLKAYFAITTPPITTVCSTPVVTTATYYTDPSSTIAYSLNSGGLQRATNNQTEELIEGVENIQILYGVDTDATPDYAANYYVPFGTAGLDMEKVISVRVSLLIRSIDDNLADAPVPYTYNGTTTTPTDRRLRRVFNTTIAVRNRLQ